MKQHRIGLVITFFAAAVFAATAFIANQQPFGYVAPAAINTGSFSSGGAVAYTPWFEDVSYRGDLIAYPLLADGTPQILAPLWHAATELNSQDYLTDRRIVTTDGAGTAMSFLWDSLTPAYQGLLGSAEMVNFIRGDRSNEGNAPTDRVRTGVLGDIIHSNPVYVGRPIAGYSEPAYLSFAAAHSGRQPMLYVGANDGMLHAFDAVTGEEVYAYIPSMLVSRLPDLADDPYSHSYYVDGPLTAEDAVIGGAWHSVLVGGLGPGGIGYFALDITSAAALSEDDAMDKTLWEFHAGSPGAVNLGYSYSRPSIVQMNDGSWAAVVGNGYLSATGAASLYVLDIADGSIIQEIVVPDAAGNGLSSPTLIDTNKDSKVDIAYAGDRNGNLWKFDLSDANPGNWNVSNGKPLFQTADLGGGVRQPITTAPEVGKHSVDKTSYMVYVATGELFDLDDGIDLSTQAVYGIWDDDWAAAELPVSMASLVAQTLKSGQHSGGRSVRTASDNPVDWDVHRGWVTPILVENPLVYDRGERVLQNITLRDNRIQFVAINPTIQTGENWYLQLDAFTGGAPIKTIVDVNEDGYLSLADNVDGDGNGEIEDTALDRVVGWYLGFGLTSLPTIGGTDLSRAAALFNRIEAIAPNEVDVPSDPGVKGGHFDVDTSHEIYEFAEGTTDGHVHEWDDKYATTTLDYFNMVPPDKLFSINRETNAVVDPDYVFFLTIQNTHLNSAGVIEINGGSLSIPQYAELQVRWLNGTLAPHERFPMYKLGALSDADKAAGIQQLSSLKISFDAFAILKGELIGTNTGCVRGNDPGAQGEYRNGALVLQAIDATGFGGWTYDPIEDLYVSNSAVLDGTWHYAWVPAGTPPGWKNKADSLYWESTVFWHWDGDCYGTDKWQEQYDACWGVDATEVCWVPDDEAEAKADKKKTKDKEQDPPPPDPDDPPPEPEVNPEHDLESVTISDGSAAGRLFWRELIPDD